MTTIYVLLTFSVFLYCIAVLQLNTACKRIKRLEEELRIRNQKERGMTCSNTGG